MQRTFTSGAKLRIRRKVGTLPLSQLFFPLFPPLIPPTFTVLCNPNDFRE